MTFLIVNVVSALMVLYPVDVGSVADVSEVDADSIFRSEVSSASVFPHSRETQDQNTY
jgi:hypothetical protein